jgi:hypothetical protein
MSAVGIPRIQAEEDVKIPIAAISTRVTTMVEYIFAPVSDEKCRFPVWHLLKGFK